MTKGIEIFTDFDGTVTKGDTVDLLLERLADPTWHDIEARWEAGEISGRECMRLQVPLIRGGWQAMLKVLETVEVDPTFKTFINWCRLRKLPVSIVSDGIDKVINHLLTREKIKINRVWANHLLEDQQCENGATNLSLAFPKPHKVVCPSGLCKCQVLDQAPSDSLKVIIGDGRSDFCWAQRADLVFAKDKLLKFCIEEGIRHVPYENFVQVRVHLDELIAAKRARAPKSGTLVAKPLPAQS